MYVSLAFLAILLMPEIAVLILVSTGVNVVSDSLVTTDQETETVKILDPRDGSTVHEVSAPYIKPLEGKTTLEFGESSKFQLFHTGIDIATKKGSPVATFMDGTVTYAGEIFWGVRETCDY